jgi:hypothetical protein
MKRSWLWVLTPLVLAACDGNPFGNTPVDPNPPPPEAGVVPPEVAQDMTAVSFVNGVLKIDMQGVTSSGEFATFVRAASLDIDNVTGGPQYEAYVYQETDLTRSYLAYVASNERGNLLAVSAADGGQFNEHNAGGNFVRLTSYTAPNITDGEETGQFSYAGTYAGIFVPGEYADGSDERPPSLRPAEPFQVVGTIQINGNFSDSVIEGGVAERQLFDQEGNRITALVFDDGDPTTDDPEIDTTELDPLSLRETSIDANGQFLGDVEFYGEPDSPVGNWAGAFGGLQASDVAGVLWLNPISGQNGIWEYGTFNLPRCDLAGASPLCIPR